MLSLMPNRAVAADLEIKNVYYMYIHQAVNEICEEINTDLNGSPRTMCAGLLNGDHN